MAATLGEIIGWFKQGQKLGCTHMIVVCDTFDHDDYPVYVGEDTPYQLNDGQDFWKVHDRYNGQSMQKIMEIYDLSMPMDHQMREPRAFHPPAKPEEA